METVEFNGWQNNVRLSNGRIELIVTRDIGPRIARLGFLGGPNLFAELAGQQGGQGEEDWMIRGGHRFWIAPEVKPDTYELDNSPIEIEDIPDGVRTLQPAGPITGVSKTMSIKLQRDADRVSIIHTLTNTAQRPITLAPWAISVMAKNGVAVVPLPQKIPHAQRVTHNQEWSIWGYTDFSDPRWTLGSRYVFFRQDPARGPNKLGMAQREGWVAYLLGEFAFVKRFAWTEGAVYPDGGVNFETFSNTDFLELESLGPLVTLAPGQSTSHRENWSIHRGVRPCASEEDVDKHLRTLIS